MKEKRYTECLRQKKTHKRRRDNHALKNVVSLRISDDELEFLQRLRTTTSKNASEIMREAFLALQRTCSPGFQN